MSTHTRIPLGVMIFFSLWELSKFIQSADGGLNQPVAEGDYVALVSVMGYLLKVKERQPETDEMFGPLQETLELLKTYEMELPQDANVLLQVRSFENNI